jgi:putative Mg2+ transporter-C (MgtC) family protein
MVQSQIEFTSVFFRLASSFFLTGLIGIEREHSNQPAGLRTHVLIGIGSTLFMLISIHLPQTYTDFPSGDPARIAAQVVSGIGFLGGGAILKLGANIRGLTTAASIWSVAALGLAVGAGLYIAAFLTTVLILFTLISLDRIEKRFFPQLFLKTVRIYTRSRTVGTQAILGIFEQVGLRVRSTDIQNSLQKQTTVYRFKVYVPRHFNYDVLYNEINQVRDVYKITVEDFF